MTSSSSPQGHYTKADLPCALLEDGRWHRAIMPTLLLWAGGCKDVWDVWQPAIAYAVLLIIDFHSSHNLDSSTMDLSGQGANISVVHYLVHHVW